MDRKLRWGAVAVVLLAVACGNDGPTGASQDELTREEAEALAEAIAQIAFVGVVGSTQATAQGSTLQTSGVGGLHPQAGEQQYTETLTVTRPCPQGGQVQLQGTINATNYPDEDRTVIDLAGTQTHDKCRVPARGRVFEISGKPNLAWTMHLEGVGGEPVGDVTFGYEGGFTWSTSGGRSGECTVDLSATVNLQQQRSTFSGTFCGITIERTATWNVSAG